MNNFSAIKRIFTLVIFGAVISGCTLEPTRSEDKPVIKGAPDWVNKGSAMVVSNDKRLFHGVSSANPHGDMALQKSIADDRSMAEVATLLATYLDTVSTEYLTAASPRDRGTRDRGVSDELLLRQIEEYSARQINEGVAHQISEAIPRQFKEAVSTQFKEDIAQHVKEGAARHIREAITNQIDFALLIEEEIARQIKESVTRQIKNTTKANMAGAKITASWRDPRTNIIWSLSELDLKHIKNTVPAAADLHVDLKRYFETNAEIVFDTAIRQKAESNTPFSSIFK